MSNNAQQLLRDALAAEARGMYSMAASKARAAAILLQGYADQLRTEVRVIKPAIHFEPLDDHLGELTIDDLPNYLRRQAE
jgi:hypothetical protein